ncbi:AAA family ATPase [Geobacillus thermoleovorans]|uniref:UvrD-helicase domain-containing protein n=1 Tax=Geobacillus TaxID=129337 RepID=UPI0005CCED7B|nr:MULTISPECIES: UvrD-helicase domain-containing protein [Geobacillus]KQB91430.1 DNA/RNA helicase [Geobacillus sp. PA-3]UPT59748.1 AAA family ATPase [Geobacillus thermoleovorans]
MNLTEEQQAVINANSRKILVKAGAGTGKTEVLTRRIVRLIEEDPSLSITEMAIITFTNKATEELQARLKNRLYAKWSSCSSESERKRFRYELELLNSSQISTIHKFCKNILSEAGPYYLDDVLFNPNFHIKNDSHKQAITEVIEVWIQEKRANNEPVEHLNIMPVHKLKDILSTSYELLRTKGLDIETVLTRTKRYSSLEERTARRLKIELVELLKRIHEHHYLLKYNSLDVDDLLEYCYKILKNDYGLLRKIQQKYRYIFIDEFQDTSLYQAEMVKLICDGSDNAPALFLVGDLKQSIYEFRGADTDSYSKIEEWIAKDGMVLTLSTNWRSNPSLVVFVNTVFDRIKKKESSNYTFYQEPLKPKDEGTHISFSEISEWILCNPTESQAKQVAEWLKKKLNNDDPSRYCLLFRKNFEIKAFEKEFTKQKIPFKVIGSGDFYNCREIIDALKLLQYLYMPTMSKYAFEALGTIFINYDHNKLDELYRNIKPLIPKFTPAQILDYIYKFTLAHKAYPKQAYANLVKLKQLARDLGFNEHITLGQFIQWLSAMIQAEKDEPQADVLDVDSDDRYVTMMTIHKAKGLEFPIVILPNLDQSISQRALNPEILYHRHQMTLEFCYEKYYSTGTKIVSKNYEEAVNLNQYSIYSEELRVLYVALTRAKEKLVLVGSANCPKSKICYQNWLKID